MVADCRLLGNFKPRNYKHKNMKPYAIINLKTFRAIKCDDRDALIEAMNTFKNNGVPYQPYKLDPENQSYIPLDHY